MSRYIDADALIEKLRVGGSVLCSTLPIEDKAYVNILLEALMDTIDAEPTADVVEVVRCEDCKWNKSTPHNPICVDDDCPKDVGYFCADGERREDG